MRMAGAIIALIAGILGTIAAGFTLFVGGVGGALRTDSASLVVALGWGGVAFSFATIVWGAIAIGTKSKTPGFLLIPSSIAGAILGGTFVAIFMALALIGGILVAVGGRSSSSAKLSPLKARPVRQCEKCSSSVAVGQTFCGNCGTAMPTLDQDPFSTTAGRSLEPGAANSEPLRATRNYQKATGNNWLAWVGGATVAGLIGLFGTFAVTASSKSEPQSTGSVGSPSRQMNEQQAQGTTAAPMVGLAESFRLGDLTIEVTKIDVKRSVGKDPFRQESSPTSVFVVVEYHYRNDGLQPLNFFDLPRVSLRDEQGVEYASDMGASAAYATESPSSAKVLSGLNPGVQVIDNEVFEIGATKISGGSLFVAIAGSGETKIVSATPPVEKVLGPAPALLTVSAIVDALVTANKYQQAASDVLKAYQSGGMLDVIALVKGCYANRDETASFCLCLDIAGHYLDASIAAGSGFPKVDFFRDEQMGSRIFQVFSQFDLDANAANDFLQTVSPPIHAAVDAITAAPK